MKSIKLYRIFYALFVFAFLSISWSLIHEYFHSLVCYAYGDVPTITYVNPFGVQSQISTNCTKISSAPLVWQILDLMIPYFADTAILALITVSVFYLKVETKDKFFRVLPYAIFTDIVFNSVSIFNPANDFNKVIKLLGVNYVSWILVFGTIALASLLLTLLVVKDYSQFRKI